MGVEMRRPVFSVKSWTQKRDQPTNRGETRRGVSSTGRKRRQLNISWAESWIAEGASSGNLRGIEDLVHSYPPTSRPRPAESSLGLNAPIPFPWPLSAYLCTPGLYTRTSGTAASPGSWCLCLYHLQCSSCRPRGRVPCRYSLSGSVLRWLCSVIRVISLLNVTYRPWSVNEAIS